MGGFKEYAQYDGLGLAELVKKKEVSPAEICEEAITRIERVNPAMIWPARRFKTTCPTVPLPACRSC
jgi:Asp-tRNA(Asn)/Glu-tRNA(Gln) amidotransferase A subunit family amidase